MRINDILGNIQNNTRIIKLFEGLPNLLRVSLEGLTLKLLPLSRTRTQSQ